MAFLLRGYREDDLAGGRDFHGIAQGGALELTWPAELTGEVLLYAGNLAAALVDGSATVSLVTGYTGLAGRSLFSLGNRRMLFQRPAARQNVIRLATTVEAGAIDTNLAEIVHPLLVPLYALFDFFDLPTAMVAELMTELRRGKRR